MNYELAVMALEGLGRAPLSVEVGERGVEIRGSSTGLRELARLLLLLGGDGVADGEEFELLSGVHLTPESFPLRLKCRSTSSDGEE